MLEIARDQFYLGRGLARFLERRRRTEPDTARLDDPEATEIIRTVLKRVRHEVPRDVPIVFAYNGDRSDHPLAKEYSGAQFCDLVEHCVDLDATVARSPA